MPRPSERDVKRLFALSGNRCAFPKCEAAIAEGTSLVGEICHIKADKPGGPRYDIAQTEAQRQAFENILLMCANHHKVIDDEDAYSVERLLKMKSEHERCSTPLGEPQEADAIVRTLIENSAIITGQRGGLAAHTVNAQSIHVHGSPSDTAKGVKAIEAIEALWKTLLKFKSEFNDVVFIDIILLASELDDCVKGNDTNVLFKGIECYSDKFYVPQKMERLLPPNSESYRLYVNVRLWALYQVMIALYGRSAMLLTISFKEETLRNWRDDTLLDQHLRSVLPGPLVDAQKQAPSGGLQRLIIILLEQAFLKEAAALQN